MSIFLVIYLLGILATSILVYLSLDKGAKVRLGDLCIFLLSVSLSWAAFVIVLIGLYHDKVLFTKK